MVSVALGMKDAAPKIFSLDLVSGAIDVEVIAGRRPFYPVLVRAPRKVGAIVKTGLATIKTTATSTTVADRSGLDMTVSVAERWRPLRVGRSFSVMNSDTTGSQRQLPPAPMVQVDRPVVLALGTEVPRQRLNWGEVPNSNGYLLRIHRVTEKALELVQERQLEKTEATIDNLAPGRYYANVMSIDASGLESGQSAPIQLRVVATTVPDGAYTTPTAIRLPGDARISLLHTEDLEMTYGHSNGVFVAAPESVGLHDGKAVRLRFREKGSALETQIQLEPLDIEPKILLEPSRATWPGDPVSIRVSLRRRDGSTFPEEAGIFASVSVNARPVSPQWQRSAGQIATQLEKPPFPGPWVVRVVVHDARGHILGRNFLEVADHSRAGFDNRNATTVVR